MDLYQEAIGKFQALFQRAQELDMSEPTAGVLATASKEGLPFARTVLLKGVDDRGFVFYTNTSSRKARQMKENPRVAMCFFWQPLMEQVKVEGRAEKVSNRESEAYWGTRLRESQIGAWASYQSEPLDSRETLERRITEFTFKFSGKLVPRPGFWSGYRIVPDRIEFWDSRPNRLHERISYQRSDTGWTVGLLNP